MTKNGPCGQNCSLVSIIFSGSPSARDLAQQRLEQATREELLRLLKATPRLNDDQVWPPPDTDWRTWVLLGGRGSGKTFAGGVLDE